MIRVITPNGVVTVSEWELHKLVCERRVQWKDGAWHKVDVAR